MESQGEGAAEFLVWCAGACLAGMIACGYAKGPQWVSEALMVMALGFAVATCTEVCRTVVRMLRGPK
jgi:hypothetical protein